jgi:hypothetical protein
MPHCEKHNITSDHKCKRCTVEKREATMMLRYGERSALHSKEIKERREKTCLEKYGSIVPANTDEIKKKTRESNMEKYGVEHTLQVKKFRDKGTATMIKKYGFEHAIQNFDIKQKRVDTYIERYGCENALQNPDVLAKRKVTNIERYGTDEILKIQSVKQQIKETMIEKYGNASPLKCEEIMDRKNITCEERYGDKDIMHNSAIFEKVVKNSFKKKEYTLPSGKTIVYQGYENVALDELLKTFKEDELTNDVKQMPKFMYEFEGKTHRYYPDLYLPAEKKIIEVKSPYTYNKQVEQNHCKRDQVMADGYTFEFWICEKTKIIEKR